MSNVLTESASPAAANADVRIAPRFGPTGAARPLGDTKQRSKHIQELIEQVGAFPDPAARELFQECLQSLLALYGDGLARILQLIDNAGMQGAQVREAFH